MAPGLSLSKAQKVAREWGAVGSDTKLKRVLNKELDINTPFGKLLPRIDIELADGDHYPALCCNPLALLHCLCGNTNFAELLETCCNGTFSIVLYTDKLQVANPLNPEHAKELQAVYIRAAANPDDPHPPPEENEHMENKNSRHRNTIRLKVL